MVQEILPVALASFFFGRMSISVVLGGVLIVEAFFLFRIGDTQFGHRFGEVFVRLAVPYWSGVAVELDGVVPSSVFLALSGGVVSHGGTNLSG